MTDTITVSPSYRISLFSIFDKKIGRFAEPFAAPNASVAERSLIDFLRSPQARLYTEHPEDFEAVEIGHFDTFTGAITEVDSSARAWFRFEDLTQKALNLEARQRAAAEPAADFIKNNGGK